MECEVVKIHYKTPYFHPGHRPLWNDPSENSMGLT